MKIQTKKEFDSHRRESMKTGGGKAPDSPGQISKLVADVIPTSVRPLSNEFDDDSIEPVAASASYTTDVETTVESEAGPSSRDVRSATCRPAKRPRIKTVYLR